MFRKKEDRPQPLPVRACEVAIKRGDMCFELFNLHIALGNRAVSRADVLLGLLLCGAELRRG